MARVPFPRNNLDPRRANSFLDSCAFDPKYAPEDQAAREIKDIGDHGAVGLLLAHSNHKELEHPNTPEDVKREARAMIYTTETDLTPDELRRRTEIHRVLTGNGKPEKYEADARHIFEASKYIGYFITLTSAYWTSVESSERYAPRPSSHQANGSPSTVQPSPNV